MLNREQQAINYTKRALITAIAGFVFAGSIAGGYELWREQKEKHDHPTSTGIRDEKLDFAYTLPSASQAEVYVGKVGLITLDKAEQFTNTGSAVRSTNKHLSSVLGLQPEAQDEIVLSVLPYKAVFQREDGSTYTGEVYDLEDIFLATPEENSQGNQRLVTGWQKSSEIIGKDRNFDATHNIQGLYVGVYATGINSKNIDMAFLMVTRHATAIDFQNAEKLTGQ